MTRRDTILADLRAAGCVASDGFAFRTDEALERAYQTWLAAGRPAGSLRMDNVVGPSGHVVEEVVLTQCEEKPEPKVLTF